MSPVQWPAVSTTVGEISVPEQRNRPVSVVNRMTPTLVCTVSRCPSMIATAGCAKVIAPTTSDRTPTALAKTCIRFRRMARSLTQWMPRSIVRQGNGHNRTTRNARET